MIIQVCQLHRMLLFGEVFLPDDTAHLWEHRTHGNSRLSDQLCRDPKLSQIMHFICQLLFLCVFVYFCEHKHGWMPVHVEARGQVLVPSTLFFKTGSFTDLKFVKQTKLMAWELQKSVCLCFPRTEIPNDHAFLAWVLDI